LYSENELRDNYSTKEKLINSDEMSKFIKWRIKHIDEDVSPSKMSNRRKRQ